MSGSPISAVALKVLFHFLEFEHLGARNSNRLEFVSVRLAY
jgi:hypothetical protein